MVWNTLLVKFSKNSRSDGSPASAAVVVLLSTVLATETLDDTSASPVTAAAMVRTLLSVAELATLLEPACPVSRTARTKLMTWLEE